MTKEKTGVQRPSLRSSSISALTRRNRNDMARVDISSVRKAFRAEAKFNVKNRR